MSPATAIIGLLMLASTAVVQSTPEQIKLQLSQRKDEIVVMWVTPYWAGTSFVEYGDTPGALTNRKWTQSNRNYNFKNGYGSSTYAREVILKNLQPNTRYYYRVGNELQGWSAQFSFKTRHEDPNRKVVFAAVADQVGKPLHSRRGPPSQLRLPTTSRPGSPSLPPVSLTP